MKPIENKIMLITYGNTLGKNLTELKDNLKKYTFQCYRWLTHSAILSFVR